jgi:glycosyltransferase involved in cell wall biosynthesis
MSLVHRTNLADPTLLQKAHPTEDTNDMDHLHRVLIVAEHASAKFGGEAILPLHYYRVLRARNVPVWLMVHERTRAELTALYPQDGSHLLFTPDTWLHKALWRVSQLLPARLAGFTTGFAMRIATQLAQRKSIHQVVRKHGITVIHQPMPVSPKEPSLMYGFGVPVVMGPMNGGMDYPPSFARMQGRFENLTLAAGRASANAMNRLIPGKRKAARLLVANERTKRALPSCVSPDRCAILVENGVDLSLWRDAVIGHPREPSHAMTHFVFMGRLVDWKAVDLLLEAFASAAKSGPMSLEIIGDGVDRSSLEQLARDLLILGGQKEVGKVHFAGWLSQAACAVSIASADALVLPSLMECGGAVVLEAMAMSLPVIATQWGGPIDYLDESCGILVEPTSRTSLIAGLTDAMQALSLDPEKRLRMGLAAREKVVQYFDWEVKVDQMMDIYRSVSI